MKITLRLTDEQAEALLAAFHNDELAAYQISNVRDVSDEQESETGEESESESANPAIQGGAHIEKSSLLSKILIGMQNAWARLIIRLHPHPKYAVSGTIVREINDRWVLVKLDYATQPTYPAFLGPHTLADKDITRGWSVTVKYSFWRKYYEIILIHPQSE